MENPNRVEVSFEPVKSLLKKCSKSFRGSEKTDEEIKQDILDEFKNSILTPKIEIGDNREFTVSCDIPNNKEAQGDWGGFIAQGKWKAII